MENFTDNLSPTGINSRQRYTAKGQTVFAGERTLVDYSLSKIFTLTGEELFDVPPVKEQWKHGLETDHSVQLYPERKNTYIGNPYANDARTTTGYKDNLRQATY